MKKQLSTVATVLSLLLVAASAFAQTGTVRANIPFKFVVDKQALPAGEYTITKLGQSGTVTAIQRDGGKEVKLVVPNNLESLKAADKTKLVFRCYGDRYFLSEIWIEGSQTGRKLPKSAHESEVAMDFTSQDVVVLASLR
jgi:hypothetical protein